MSTEETAEILVPYKHLVPLVRAWLEEGVSATNLASSVRLGEMSSLKGGLKADLVGQLPIEVQVVVKLGEAEIENHGLLMRAANDLNDRVKQKTRLLQKGLFPEVMGVTCLKDSEPDLEGKYLMLMQALVGYKSLENDLYGEDPPPGEDPPFAEDPNEDQLWSNLRTAMAMLDVIHELPFALRLPTTHNPYSGRLRQKLEAVTGADRSLARIWSEPGMVMGTHVPSLNEQLLRVDRWLDDNPPQQTLLVHGDCHLGNVMWHKRYRHRSIRLIDPNPEIGFTDVSYDWGKLAHFLDTVGWVRRTPELCRSRWSEQPDSWSLEACFKPKDEERERIRSNLFLRLKTFLEQAHEEGDPEWHRRFLISTAAAHLGLAAILAKQGEEAQCRFVLAYALGHLGEFGRGLD